MKKNILSIIALLWAGAAAAQIALPPLTTTTVTITKDALDRVIRIEHTGVYVHLTQYDPVGNIIGLQRTSLGSTLPVELVNFTATAKDCDAVLEWQTATERNTDRFVVELSTDGSSFKVAGSVKAVGNSNTVQNYSFIAPIVSKPTYYRLLAVDFDGTIKNSTVRSATCEGQFIVSLYPNPTDGIVNLYSETRLNSIEVVDMLGRLLSAITPTENNTPIDLNTYPAGVYNIRVKTDNNVVNLYKVIKN